MHEFEFAGIPKPKLKELIKPFIKDTAKKRLIGTWFLHCGNVNYRKLNMLHLSIYRSIVNSFLQQILIN